jgi:hypothetical protein
VAEDAVPVLRPPGGEDVSDPIADRRARILDAAGVTDSDLSHEAQEALDAIVQLPDEVIDGLVDLIHVAQGQAW